MPRNHTSSALLACQKAIDSESACRLNVTKLQANSKMLAENYLYPDSEFEKALEADKDDDMAAFLKECRSRLKSIAEGNAKRMNEIDYFIEAVKEVKNDVVRRQQQPDEEEAVDYEAVLHSAVERIRDSRAVVDKEKLEQHELVVEIKSTLGEKTTNDDDDLEIVTNRNADDVHAIKCPITGMIFTDPVKNKVCHHTYSRQGLQQLLNNRKTTCPVAGCSNNRLSLQQVEEDEEMKMKVVRFRKREELNKRKRELEQEDDDEEMGEGGFTMIQ